MFSGHDKWSNKNKDISWLNKTLNCICLLWPNRQTNGPNQLCTRITYISRLFTSNSQLSWIEAKTNHVSPLKFRRAYGHSDGHMEVQTDIWRYRRTYGGTDWHMEVQTDIWIFNYVIASPGQCFLMYTFLFIES